MNVKNNLITTLETAFPNYPVFLQGTLEDDEAYPNSFITVWTPFTLDNTHYNNATYAIDWHFSVLFYSNNPTLIGTVPDSIRSTLKAAGYIADGKGNDIPSDVPTHTGWAMDFIYKEIL